MNYICSLAKKSSAAILRFFRTRGGNFIPAAIKLFVAKSRAQLLYGAQLGPFSNLAIYGKIQSGFLRSLFLTPRSVSNATLRMESGLIRIEAHVWQITISTWLRLKLTPAGLLPLIFQDNYQMKWWNIIKEKLCTYGFSTEHLLAIGLEKAKDLVKQRIWDIELQNDLSQILYIYHSPQDIQGGGPAAYLSSLTYYKYRWAFTRARYNVLPSKFTEGRYQGIPVSQRLCPCDSGEIETSSHVLLYCSFYSEARSGLIHPLLQDFPGNTDEFYTKFLLADRNPSVTYKVAKFCHLAMRTRRHLLTSEDC
ncbi:uncharacterized protein LOC134410782 [Elgaria multicarinata webbii]|uniref:uncharacterized protein LOC134410782 n=1 Tax=Elgaria multicarinata webbii TaxID=159646 RepID=UPI002FCD1763